MALRDYLPSFMRREQDAGPDLLGELTPSERQRLNSTEKDPIEYWERAGDKTLLSDDIIKSMESSNRAEVANGWTRQDAEAMNAHIDAKAAREWERSEPDHESVRRAERMADATDPIHDERREQQADNHRPRERSHQETDEMKPTLAEKKQADIDYWRGVISRDRAEIAEAVQKVHASERNAAEQPAQAEDAIARQGRRVTSRVAPVVVAAVATSFVATAQAQDIGFLRSLSESRTNAVHAPQQKPDQVQQESLRPAAPGLACAHIDQWQPVRAQPSDSAPVLGYTQAQIAVAGTAGGGYERVLYYNGKTGYVPEAALKPARTCSIAGMRPNGAPVFQFKAG